MTATREESPLALDAADEVRRLREALDKAEYDTSHIAKVLRVEDGRVSTVLGTERDRALAVFRTTGDDPLRTLTRLFILGEPVDADAARRALAPATPEALAAAGLLQNRNGRVAAAVQITPVNQFLLVADPLWATDIRPLHVVGAGGPSVHLAQLTVRRHSRRTLDMGAGCGIQAFLAAAHSDEVVGVDRNPRAVNMAAFNAQLNALDRVQFVEGDLYAPVRDRQFDLIAANPPYVISPGSEFMYRDSGLKGDEIAQRVIREGAELLEEGGYLQLTCEWAHTTGTDWQARLNGWFEGTGCDAFVLRFSTVEPDLHAAMWLCTDPSVSAAALPERMRQWIDSHRAAGIEAVSDGVISLRKRTGGRNWVRIDDSPQRIGGCGTAVERAFAATDFLTSTTVNDSLLEDRLTLNPEVRWEQRLRPSADGWEVFHSQLYLAAGLASRGDASRQGLALVELCDGKRTVREVLTKLSELGGLPVDTLLALSVVRQLVEQGFLLPAAGG